MYVCMYIYIYIYVCVCLFSLRVLFTQSDFKSGQFNLILIINDSVTFVIAA